MSKSGREQGAENVKKLVAYLSSVEALPERGGKVNTTAVAEACGFDRQTLYKNPNAKQVLEDAVKSKGLVGIKNRDEDTDPVRIVLERQVTELQQTNSSLMAEVHELRAKLKQYRHVEEIMEKGRRVLP
jgi:hypothetical protein